MSGFVEKILSEKERYLTAGVLIAVIAVAFIINHPLVIWGLLGLCFVAGFVESLKLFSLKPSVILTLSAIGIWIMAYFNTSPISCGVFVAMGYAGWLAYRRSISPKTILPFIYPTLPFLILYALYKDMGAYGLSSLIWLIVCVAFTDTGAYFGGRLFGRNPLTPTSPKKTIEGAGVGVVLGIVVGSIAGIGPSGGFIPSLLISVVVSVSSVLGDLFESYLKREADVKDSGSILPGHGGVLDRFDGIFFGGIAMYFLLSFLRV